jgi:NAD(P)H-nitrite reductase large subunit
MKQEEHVCVCHGVSLGKLQSYLQRENPKVASQLSECLDSGTSCGWCIPFLEKLHKQHCLGEQTELSVDHNRYVERRSEYKKRKRANKEKNDG